MAQSLKLFIWVLVLLSNPILIFSLLENFMFNGFSDAYKNMTFNGASIVQHNGILCLTYETRRVLGHAFYSSKVQVRNPKTKKALSFSTNFAFAIVPQHLNLGGRLGGHGLAFTISPTQQLSGTLPSQYLGLFNATDIGNSSNHVFAVEFDTVRDFEFEDINDNHIGIDINNLVSKRSVPAAHFLDDSSKVDLNLSSGKVILAWIDYDSVANRLDVRLSLSSTKPEFSVLSYDVDLSEVFEDFMYVGFSASTGLLASSHYILGWSFNMSGNSRSLVLADLPILPDPNKKSRVLLIVGVTVAASVLLISVTIVAFYLMWKIKNMDVIEEWELHVGPHRFSYEELKKATKGFRDKELIGFGGFGRVYKGTLPNSDTQVAVKRISHDSKQGWQEFLSEIATIGRVRHRNLVQLLGWCRRRQDLLLVYDFMSNGSLDKFLFDEPKSILSWEQRLKIIKDVASGLLYLHEEWEQTVIHRDVKAGNVLLDSELNGRLGDFGLAKLYERGSNPSTTRVVGTLGYLAPELTRTGKPTTNSDVFAFGALILEVVCGRKPIEPKALPEELILVDWVWEKCKRGEMFDVVDQRLNGEFKKTQVVLAIQLGLMCSNNTPNARPSMRQVVRYLDGQTMLPNACDGEKGFYGCEDYADSYPNSSYLELEMTSELGFELDEQKKMANNGIESPWSDHTQMLQELSFGLDEQKKIDNNCIESKAPKTKSTAKINSITKEILWPLSSYCSSY
ncbi:hypothetical protein ACFE04_029822 [Oxalis oulophora]